MTTALTADNTYHNQFSNIPKYQSYVITGLVRSSCVKLNPLGVAQETVCF